MKLITNTKYRCELLADQMMNERLNKDEDEQEETRIQFFRRCG